MSPLTRYAILLQTLMTETLSPQSRLQSISEHDRDPPRHKFQTSDIIYSNRLSCCSSVRICQRRHENAWVERINSEFAWKSRCHEVAEDDKW
jgi:hypothetical protein